MVVCCLLIWGGGNLLHLISNAGITIIINYISIIIIFLACIQVSATVSRAPVSASIHSLALLVREVRHVHDDVVDIDCDYVNNVIDTLSCIPGACHIMAYLSLPFYDDDVLQCDAPMTAQGTAAV